MNFFYLIIARYLSVSETLERYLAIRNQTFLINFLEQQQRRRQIAKTDCAGWLKVAKLKKKK